MRALVVLCFTLTIPTSLGVVPFANGSGLLYVSPTESFVTSLGGLVTVRIQVANVGPFTGWDVQVKSDQSVLIPSSLSVTGNALAANYSMLVIEKVHCLNGVNDTKSNCDSIDGPGIVHSAVTASQGTSRIYAVYGLLFTINYTVVGSASYSPLQIQRSIISDGADILPVEVQSGIYGILPGQGFTILAGPNSTSIVQGSNSDVTITVSSLGGFSGVVDLSTEASHPGLQVSLNTSRISISPDHSSNIAMTIVALDYYPTGQNTITVTATSRGISHDSVVSVVTIDKPDFAISASPSTIEIHAAGSASSTITVESKAGFSGSVHLNVAMPVVPGLTVSLVTLDLTTSSNVNATTVLVVSVPRSDAPFVYLVNITAKSQDSPALYHNLTVLVTPPSPDFQLALTGGNLDVQSGESRILNLTLTSIDYFSGKVNLSATTFYGVTETFSPPAVQLDFSDSFKSALILTTDAKTVLGRYNVTVNAIGTTISGKTVKHDVVFTFTVVQAPSLPVLFGLQPPAYFVIIGGLLLASIGILLRRAWNSKRNRSSG